MIGLGMVIQDFQLTKKKTPGKKFEKWGKTQNSMFVYFFLKPMNVLHFSNSMALTSFAWRYNRYSAAG